MYLCFPPCFLWLCFWTALSIYFFFLLRMERSTARWFTRSLVCSCADNPDTLGYTFFSLMGQKWRITPYFNDSHLMVINKHPVIIMISSEVSFNNYEIVIKNNITTQVVQEVLVSLGKWPQWHLCSLGGSVWLHSYS